ncbi:MAG: type II toxin-antitoxin system Phd/YefM family antitoxin [Bacillota bacterium]
MQINVHEAKTHFSKLLARVEEGEEVIIARAGVPVARMVPITDRPNRRMPGSAKGWVVVAPDFEEPLPETVLEDFER